MPKFICGFIMDLDGKTKPASQRRSGNTTAQKIRAALTYFFGILCGLGNVEWHKDPTTGRMIGNPSISSLVSRYMVGLQRRKAGEAPTSARAITPAILRRLYLHNRRDYDALEAGNKDDLRARLLQCAYTISFICLLRFDEVLGIQMQDLTFHADGSVELRLPYRKTDQNGGACGPLLCLTLGAHWAAGTVPFVLWWLESDEAHLCPVRALAEWLDASGIKKGYLFPKLTSEGSEIRSMGSHKDHMTAENFLELFRQNLLHVGVDYSPYGTHSFRRGDRKWNIRRVCEWGGWSTDFTHLTIVKYLISWVDEPMSSRADFFRPGQRVARLCRTCGRSCPCNS
ncbi:DNA breaking-rejoining enzyme [Schizophyllum commune]